MSGLRPHRETKSERASRVRENKRRHRVRHKEYVMDLERRAAQAQEQGIQATREMQLAAQRVARENVKLRNILGKIGYSDETIEAWLREDGHVGGSECHLRLEPVPGYPARTLPLVPQPPKERVECKNTCVNRSESLLKLSESGHNLDLPKHSLTPAVRGTSKEEMSPKRVCQGTCSDNSSPNYNRKSLIAPCRLMSSLATNPTADITQAPLSIRLKEQSGDGNELEADDSDGVECSTAYKMLMYYATSEDKVDRIAAALESGCTPSGGDGCKVKSRAMWKILDEECT